MPPGEATLRALTASFAFLLLLAIALPLAARTQLVFFTVPSSSMQPTLLAGDVIVAKRVDADDPLVAGDVVILAPADGNRSYVKRVVALPGDYVEIVAGELRVNGVEVREPYRSLHHDASTLAALIVPPHSVFVLGDHRPESVDSRTWGPLPRGAVIGVARRIAFSSGEDGFRFRRIARAIH
jgi:signal peptidase I